MEYLKVEIIPEKFHNRTMRRLKIRTKISGKELVSTEEICNPDDLVSFFDQIWGRAKKEILKLLKEDT